MIFVPVGLLLSGKVIILVLEGKDAGILVVINSELPWFKSLQCWAFLKVAPIILAILVQVSGTVMSPCDLCRDVAWLPLVIVTLAESKPSHSET